MPTTRRRVPVSAATLDVAGLIRAIRAAAEQHNSYDSHSEGLAIDALQAGRPVFWSKTRYHNQRACVLLDEANKLGLAAALCADAHRHDSVRRYHHIDTLIPITPSAQAALEEARWQIADARQAAE